MKLRKLRFWDIEKRKDDYIYTYGVYATSLFKKLYFKLVFESKLPHFWWSEIQKMHLNQGYYFEDLVKGKPLDIKIGKLTYLDLTDEDIIRFSKNPENWESKLAEAIEKQQALEDEYNEIHGVPDLKGTGLLSDYNPGKDW